MKIIYLLIGFSFIYSECNDYSLNQCNNDNSCEWVEDIETGNCGTLVGDDCELNPECNWNCDFVDDYMGWCNYSCDGGPYEIDNSYCQEIEMPECSEMNQSECSSNGSCDWVEDIDWGSCYDLDPIWNVVYYCDDPSTNSDNCYTYTCYGGGYGQWGTCCGGDPYIIANNSYCEEIQMPDCSEEFDFECNDGSCIPIFQLCNGIIDCEDGSDEASCEDCSDLNELDCNTDNSCEWVEDTEWGNCSEFDQNSSACDETPGCYGAYLYPGWYSGWYCAGGTYQIDNNYCQEVEYQLGDINNDLVINVLDVIEVISLIIDNEYNYIVDMNNDLDINVLDIIELVNIILNNN